VLKKQHCQTIRKCVPAPRNWSLHTQNQQSPSKKVDSYLECFFMVARFVFVRFLSGNGEETDERLVQQKSQSR
jgi:hypothetical protein